MKKDEFKTTGIYLGNTYYGIIEDYPFDKVKEKGPDALRKAVAYRYYKEIAVGDKTLIMDYVMPYRGIITDDMLESDLSIGIWFKRIARNKWREIIIRPKTPKEKEDYSSGREFNLMAAILDGEISPDDYIDNQLTPSDIGSDVYMPPIHAEDDALSMILKLAIRLKGASFAPYGKRLEAFAADSSDSSGKANAKNNTRRALDKNNTTSSNKFCFYANTWQVEPAIVLRDMPGAMHPMHIPEGKMLVIYPTGMPYPISSEDLLDITDMVADAIYNSDNGQDSTEDKNEKTEENNNG